MAGRAPLRAVVVPRGVTGDGRLRVAVSFDLTDAVPAAVRADWPGALFSWLPAARLEFLDGNGQGPPPPAEFRHEWPADVPGWSGEKARAAWEQVFGGLAGPRPATAPPPPGPEALRQKYEKQERVPANP